MSHSMAKLSATAAWAAAGMFSMMPRARSCSPRWATGRAVSQSGARTRRSGLRDLEDSFDLDRRIGRKRGDTDGGAGMAALVTEDCNHQVGSAVQHFRSVQKVRGGIDEAAKPDHADHLVEIAHRGLDLCQQVDGTATGCGVALLDGDPGAELALGDQLAVRTDADLSRYEQQVSGAHEPDVIRDRARRRMQDDALCRKFLFDRTRHVSSPFDVISTRYIPDRAALFRASSRDMQARADRGANAKKHGNPAAKTPFPRRALVAAQYRGEYCH